MTRIILITLLSLVVLLVGASAVLAQDRTAGYGHRMMQSPSAPGAPANPTPPTTTPGGNGVCPLGGGTGTGQGHMGYGAMMNGDEMNAAHEAMQNGDWEAMYNACQKAWEKNQGQVGQDQPTSATPRTSPRNRSMMTT